MKTLTTLLAAAGLLALTACAEPPPPPAPPPPPRPAPGPPPPSEPDQCGSAEAQKYVGRSRTEIPVPVQPSRQRVACTTCPVTMDFNPRRLNFFYDAATGVVREVKCG
ncbi:peptidase inhibitor I78 [Phenylobacterium sp. LH3H17]|uniref:peptidase inhibitor I78 n=1 Tax=Phenylobacterium sp. LH3H17 TaxID=2903901 RepID=UPI0020C9B351|nr:peptidase inhibitor I78 [Phenylobacterium sp. LH3H17]UTP37860.1 peptidase inhibitor I78 [Phenylobacterium sp. LH3H17]